VIGALFVISLGWFLINRRKQRQENPS